MASPFTLPMLADWLLTAQSSLRAARAEIDALNVFPVPDGDTGTNLYLTGEAACAGFRHGIEMDFGMTGDQETADQVVLEAADPESAARHFEATARQIGRDAILGARGNSGVIMSALLRDLCASIAREPQAFALALRAGTAGAYSAVAAPVEGTILTVARACADQAEEIAQRGGELPEIVRGAADAAYQALLKTPDLLEQLRIAGVVDAGGRGLVVVLDSLVTSLTGIVPRRDLLTRSAGVSPKFMAISEQSFNDSEDFEVMYHLECESVDRLHEALAAVGQSIMIAGMDGTWNVHVHVSPYSIADAINAGLTFGTVSKISVTPLGKENSENELVNHHSPAELGLPQDALTHQRKATDSPFAGRKIPQRHRSLIAVTHGWGVESLLAGQGITCVPTLARQQPSAAELISAGKRAESAQLVLLPSDKDAHAVAEIAALELRAQGMRAAVVPTKSITQTLAAAAVHDPDQDFEQDVVNMTRASSSTRYGAVTQATRNVLTMAGECQLGDILGVIDGEIAVIGGEFADVSHQVLGKMLAPGAELVTVVCGQDSEDSDLHKIRTWIHSHNPLLDVDVIHGGQPLWPFIFGVE
jgi:DAK2 domain fusion protein YloV